MEHITSTRKDVMQSTPPAKITSSSAIKNTASSESKSPICLQTLRFGVDPLSRGQECRVGKYRKVYMNLYVVWLSRSSGHHANPLRRALLVLFPNRMSDPLPV